ncbi:MAG: amidohydrolase, partial [Saprospiraceae bacterium]|nr:amidohydrolase [Saprospiraceae bacterium]
MMYRFLGVVLLCCFSLVVQGQITFPSNGAPDEREGLMAFTNATIHKSYNQKIENATLLIRDGKVEAVGQGINIPDGAVIKDCKGMTIYPSFIELYSNYGLPEPTAAGKAPRRKPQMLSNKKGAFGWNEAIKPEFNASENFSANAKAAKELRKLGFAVAQTHMMDGIARGTGAAVLLSDDREQETVIKSASGNFLSFKKGKSTQSYPNSLMGGIALIKQTQYDADWYRREGKNKETNLSLQAWNENQFLPQFFETRDRLEALRAIKLGKDLSKKYIILGSGDEYKRITELKATGASFIVPVNFPKAFDVEDPYDALQADLHDLRHWELAPTNAARLKEAGIQFALTSHGLKKKDSFMSMLQKAIKHGLSEEAALQALTATPAELMG